ncbi:hypothetical protein C922_05457, partial [Plasmodium inui San Antonio 1]
MNNFIRKRMQNENPMEVRAGAQVQEAVVERSPLKYDKEKTRQRRKDTPKQKNQRKSRYNTKTRKLEHHFLSTAHRQLKNIPTPNRGETTVEPDTYKIKAKGVKNNYLTQNSHHRESQDYTVKSRTRIKRTVKRLTLSPIRGDFDDH